MLNILWSFLILFSVILAFFTNRLEAINDSFLSSSKEAVDLLILMLGVISMWNGFLCIAEGSGLTDLLAKKMRPIIRFLFPNIPDNNPVNSYICANFIANILGLSWACTPTGLKTMDALSQLEQERKELLVSESKDTYSNKEPSIKKPNATSSSIISDEMCTFLLINISSLQLIPINMIAFRSQYGSTEPFAVVLPGLLATIISTGCAIILCKILSKRRVS